MSAFGIALLTETWYPEVGGGESQSRLLARALSARGHPVSVVTRRSRPGLPAVEDDEGVRILRIPPTARGHLAKWGLLFTAGKALHQNADAFDVVLVSGFRVLGAPAVRACGRLGKPCVLKADSRGEMSGEFFRAGLARFGVSPASPFVRPLLARRDRWLRRADGFVALSAEIDREFRAAGIAAGKIRRIPNAVDTVAFCPATTAEKAALRHRLGLPDGAIAVFVGRLVRYKGLFTLMKAWTGLPDPPTLLVLGGGTSDIHSCEAELRSFVAAQGLQSSVRFTGPVTNVAEWLRAADFFVFPTEDEAFGLSLAEAMACGLPVITTPVGGIPDYVADGENGLFVPPSDPVALAAAVRRVLHEPGLAECLGDAARETAARDFAVETVTDAWIALFGELHAARQRSAP